MDRPAQLVYEGTRSFRKFEFTIEIVVINLYKFGVFEVLLRDQDSQCALPPIYLRSAIIEHRIKPADVDELMTSSRHLFDPTEQLGDDDLYDLVVRVQIFNFIADRLSIKKRARDSTEMYEVEYLPALFDPEFGPGKNRLDLLVCEDPYYFGAPAPLKKNLSLTKQGTSDTIISTSVRLDSHNNHHHHNTEAGANPSATKTVTVSTRVNSALRTLSTLFASGKGASSSSSRSVKPVMEEKGMAAAIHSNSASQSASQSQSQSQDRSRSQSEDRSDMAVQRLMNSNSFRNTATAEMHRSGSNKNFNTTNTTTTISAKHTLQVLVQPQDKNNTNTSSKNNTINLYSNPNPNHNPSTNSNTTNTITNTVTNTTSTTTHTTTSAKQPYHQSLSGLRGQELAQQMLTRLEDLPDISGELLGTVIYLPVGNSTKASSDKGTSDATSGASVHNTTHATTYNTYNTHDTSSKKTVDQHRLAAYFQPQPLPLPLFSSIEDLCDPSVIERIPNRTHPFMQPPRCVSRLSVEVWGTAEVESAKTEAYNQPTSFFASSTASINVSMFPTYYNTAFLTTSPNDVGSPCMSIQEEEAEEYEVVRKVNINTAATNTGAHTNTLNVELEGQVAFSAQRKPTDHNSTGTNNTNPSTSTPNTTTTTTAVVGTEKQTSRVVRPIVSMLRSALQGHAKVGVVVAGEE